MASRLRRPPLPKFGALDQLSEGYERDARLHADQARHRRRGKPTLQTQGRDVRVEDYAIHGRSDEVGVTGRADVREEGVQLLVGVEGVVLGEILNRPDRLDVLTPALWQARRRNPCLPSRNWNTRS